MRHDLYNLEVTDIEDGLNSPVETEPCPVCENTLALPRFAIQDCVERVVQCSRCGLGILHPQPDRKRIQSFYPREYYGDSGEKFVPFVEWMIRLVAARQARFVSRSLPRGARVLDVGCGRGVLLRALREQGCEAHGFEISEDATKGADPGIQMQIASNLTEARYADDMFDRVVIWHVLEHLPDPRRTLLEIHRILKPDGKVIVAVPNFSSLQARWTGADWFHLDLPRHLYHFPISALKTLLANCGFECRSEFHFSFRQNPFGWLQSVLNRCSPFQKNALYDLLHHRMTDENHTFGFSTRLCLKAAFVFGMPWAVFAAVISAFLRKGGTIHVSARARKNESPEEVSH